MDLRIEDQRKARLLAALLVSGTLLLYLPIVHHNFIQLWDDDAYVTDNPHVRSGLELSNLTWALTSFEQSNWHPATWWSHMLDCQLFGLNPGPQHYVNVLLHAANVLLLFWILQRATRSVGKSFVVAALFAVHPLNVETVAWVAQRKSVLSAFFSLFAVAAYGWYARGGGWKKYLALIGAFALALMSKPMAVSLPVLMLLFDYWPLQRLEELPFWRRWSKLMVEKLPLFAMSAASSVLTEMAQGSGGSVMGLSLLPIPTRIENAAISCVAYIGKVLWPLRLATYYPLRFSPPLADAVASATILIAVSALVLYCRRQRYLVVGWLFFLIALIPVIGIVQVGFQGMADRYMYIPAIGLFIAVVWGLSEIVEHLAVPKAVPALVALSAIGSYSVATVHYLRYWQDGVTLFANAEAAWGQPDMWLEQLYGNALFSAGRIDEALVHYEQSCAIQPRTEYCHYNIAHILSGRSQFQQALDEYQQALNYTANRNMALLCLTESAEAQMRLGAYDAAQASIAKALLIDPADGSVLRLREEILARRNAN